jgi:hypothetical protein
VAAAEPVEPVDPFDLPEWLGKGAVTWTAESSVRSGHHVPGHLSAADGTAVACDLLGADQAFPRPVLADDWRQRSHQTWAHGEVLLIEYGGRLTLAVPGSSFDADLALEAVGRFAKAVGVAPSEFLVALRP